MTNLEQLRRWLSTFPGFDILSEFQVDYIDRVLPGNGGLFPSGLVEVSRSEDILGNVTVENQCNFAIYAVFAKAPGDDDSASVNADWVMEFQAWVQMQSCLGLAPRFGNTDDRESIQAQNGVLYEALQGGTAVYLVQLNVRYKQKYEVV